MSLKGPLRRLAADVEWLENEGTFRHLEILFEMIETKQQIADNLARDKATAAEFERAGLLRRLDLPPPSWARQPAAPAPRPVAVAPPPPPEPAPRSQPIKALGLPSADRDATLRAARQDEVVRVATPPLPPKPPPPPEPAPPLVQPFDYDPPPEMQIRPVHWRRRGPQDYDDDDSEDMYGKCIVDYDPLGYLDDDDG